MKKFSTLLLGFTLISITIFAKAYDFVVAKDGTGDFQSIQSAIDASKAFPDKVIRIYIKNGIYTEKVKVAACNTHLQIIGENQENVIIRWDDYFERIGRGRNSTFYTYTLLIEADDFRMENITVENAAGRIGQAVAIHTEGDRIVFKNCKFIGNQDTMYLAGQSRVYLFGCYIEGTTDYIFGAATAYFEECELHSKSNSYITAASTPNEQKYGFVFYHCHLTAAKQVSKAYLGRPWRDYAKVVFIESNFGSHILPEGWSNWSGTTRDKTAFFAEYKNTGAGSAIEQRVKWSYQLTKKQFRQYNKEQVLGNPTQRSASNWFE